MGESYLDLVMAQEEEIVEAEGGGGGIWVVADVIEGTVAPVTLEALGAARTLADSLGAYVYGVLLGEGVTDLAQPLYQAGADGVRVADHESLARFALEPYLAVLGDLLEEEQPEVVLFGATLQGTELAGRLAQRMGGGLIERAVAVSLDEATRTVQAATPIYGGEYFEIGACPGARPQFLTIDPGAFSTPFLDPGRKGEPREIEVEAVEPAVRVLGEATDFEPPPVPLDQAPVIVAAGRQAGDFEMVERLAAALGGRLAGDRGARDAGWIEREQVVDVRGVSVAPNVYVAVGIRGDTFHNAAIEEAKFILAIHPDPDAPIFEMADMCLEAEPADVLPPLLEALEG
jgi:electron transfer flavoprotein alpha subunit